MNDRTDCPDEQREPTENTYELAQEPRNLAQEPAGSADDPCGAVKPADDPRFVLADHVATSNTVDRSAVTGIRPWRCTECDPAAGCRESTALDSGMHGELACLAGVHVSPRAAQHGSPLV